MDFAGQQYAVQAINSHSSMKELNLLVAIGGRVVIPPTGRFLFPRGHLAKIITVGSPGTVVVENVDGDCVELEFFTAGQKENFVCRAVLQNGFDIDGNAITTTATGIRWRGAA